MISIESAKAHPDYKRIPLHIISDIHAYVTLKRDVGYCLKSILNNRLFEAFRSADTETQAAMRDIITFINSEVRSDCYGTPERVKQWLCKDEND